MIQIPEKFFPCTMITLSVLAAVVYAFHHDWRRVLYWICSALIISSVTF